MNDNSKMTDNMDAALLGNRNFCSKKAAMGSRRIENKHEKIRGDKISFAMITKYPIAKRLNNTQASLI